MPANLFTTLSAIVTFGRGPLPRVTTADRLQSLALRRRLDRYV
jgi:hypothetical protein